MSDKRVAGSNPRVAREAVLTAAALAAVIFAGGFTRPQKTLAFSPVPTAVTSSQLAAADAACRAPVEGYPDYPVPFAGSTLINLELFGNGGVAIYSNGVTTGACMVLIDGETAVAGIRADQVSSKEFINTGGSTEFAGQRVSMLIPNLINRRFHKHGLILLTSQVDGVSVRFSEGGRVHVARP